MRVVLALLVGLALIACEGPTGPEGPQGPPGPQGAQGPQGPPGENALVYTASGTLNASGAGSMSLPADVVNSAGLPSISCYISSNGQTWLSIDHTPTSDGWPFCGVVGYGSQSPAVVISSSSGFSGYLWYIVAVF